MSGHFSSTASPWDFPVDFMFTVGNYGKPLENDSALRAGALVQLSTVTMWQVSAKFEVELVKMLPSNAYVYACVVFKSCQCSFQVCDGFTAISVRGFLVLSFTEPTRRSNSIVCRKFRKSRPVLADFVSIGFRSFCQCHHWYDTPLERPPPPPTRPVSYVHQQWHIRDRCCSGICTTSS